MKTNQDGWLFYLCIAILYGSIFSFISFIFNLFTDTPNEVLDLLLQGFFFGLFMTLFDYWRMRSKNKKK